jgi:hypothetical protein
MLRPVPCAHRHVDSALHCSGILVVASLLAASACHDPGWDGRGLFQPAPGTSWQWQLSGRIDTSLDVEMYDIDLFDVSDQVLSTLIDRGRAVICYFSAGSFEDWRDDAASFPEEALGQKLEGWKGERWLDIRNAEVRAIVQHRLDRALERGCDGVEPDNVDGYENETGFDLTAADQTDFNGFVAAGAHARGLSVGLKNDVDQVASLEPDFDWALNEECDVYDECGVYAAFTDNGKAAFHVEYVDDWANAERKAADVCARSGSLDTLIKTWDLGAERLACE